MTSPSSPRNRPGPWTPTTTAPAVALLKDLDLPGQNHEEVAASVTLAVKDVAHLDPPALPNLGERRDLLIG